jgi:hypothetical protein
MSFVMLADMYRGPEGAGTGLEGLKVGMRVGMRRIDKL